MNKITTQVSDIMTIGVIAISPEDTLDMVAQLFEKYGFNGFPVVDQDKKLVGILTAYEMIVEGSGVHLSTIMGMVKDISEDKIDNGAIEDYFKKIREIKVKQVMNVDPLVVSPDAKVEDLGKEFALHHRVNPIPVVDNGKRLLGIVSRYDIIKFFNEQYVKDIVKDTGHGGVLRRLERVGGPGMIYQPAKKSMLGSLWVQSLAIATVIIILFLAALNLLTG